MPKPKRVDIISDTHGYLSPELLDALEGADLVVHAGDITSEEDWEVLKSLHPIKAVLGNNDGYYDYGSEVEHLNVFVYEGVRFAVSHYFEDLPTGSVDVGVCGHTHRAQMVRSGRALVVNPGSASYPRDSGGPSMARMFVSDGEIQSVDIIRL